MPSSRGSSGTAELLKGGLALCKDNFMVADGAVTKGVFGSVETTFEENDFVLELSLKVDGFEAPLSLYTVGPKVSIIIKHSFDLVDFFFVRRIV